MRLAGRGQRVRGAPEPAPLTVSVDWGLAYESLIGLALFVGGGSIHTYEVGANWFKSVRKAASPQLKKAARRLLGDDAHAVTGLAGLAARAGGRSPARLVQELRECDPSEVTMGLRLDEHRSARARRAPSEVATLAADVLELWEKDIFSELATDLEPQLQASALAVQRLQLHLAPDRLITRVTRGVEYRREPWIRSVTLVPSVLNRPWVDINEWQGIKYFFYPAATDGESASAHVAEVYKALGDETRLQILRLLTSGATSLGDLASELGLAKSTVSQHMAVLRAAGLTRSLVGGEGRGYTLNERPDLNELLEQLLMRDA